MIGGFYIRRNGGAQHWPDMGRRAMCGGPMLRPYAAITMQHAAITMRPRAITMQHAAVRSPAITMQHAAVQGRSP
jgi:hypothetical protein